MDQKFIADVAAGTAGYEEFTAEELQQRETDLAAFAAAQEAEAEKQAAQAIARSAAIDHAKTLGFTDEMIAVMYPNLQEA